MKYKECEDEESLWKSYDTMPSVKSLKLFSVKKAAHTFRKIDDDDLGQA